MYDPSTVTVPDHAPLPPFKFVMGSHVFYNDLVANRPSLRRQRHYRKTGHSKHLVLLSPWPLLVSVLLFHLVGLLSCFFFLICIKWKTVIFVFFFFFYSLYFWFYDISIESTFTGNHTRAVSRGLRLGMLLFILSEVMFFLSFFWAFFNASLSPTIWIGSVWPPDGFFALSPWGFPFFNTVLLVYSGLAITVAHQAFSIGLYHTVFFFFRVTIYLGLCFIFFQYVEYRVAYFAINSGIYGSLFYMATGFHGLHVFFGICFLAVVFRRFKRYRLRSDQHFSFEAAIWYWHFVDVVWLFLFAFVYWWGSALETDAPLSWASQFHFQDTSNRFVELIGLLYDDIFIFLIAVIAFVSYIMGISIYLFSSFIRYRRSVPKNRTITHNSLLEVFWTVVPAIFLICIGGPSTAVLYSPVLIQNDSSFYVRVLATQWYWVYSYSLTGLLSTLKKEFTLESFMLNKPFTSLKFGQFRLLNCTTRLTLPTNQYIKFFITSTDVIHSFSVPALFLKVDACPGKLNEFASLLSRGGIFYGQCSEICGTNHSFMPIMLEGISDESFFNNFYFFENQLPAFYNNNFKPIFKAVTTKQAFYNNNFKSIFKAVTTKQAFYNNNFKSIFETVTTKQAFYNNNFKPIFKPVTTKQAFYNNNFKPIFKAVTKQGL